MLVLVGVLYVLPSLLVDIPYIQRRISDVATAELTDRLGVPVRIGRVDMEWPNRVVLEELYLEDQRGRELFKAIHVSAGLDIRPLLRGKLVFTTVRLFSPVVHLSKPSAGEPLNLQFVLDAFASKDTARKKKSVDLRFNTVLVRKGHFTYDVEDMPATPGKFNARHIDVSNISAKISLRAFNKDSLNAQVKKLSFDEASGFSLEKLTVGIAANRDSAYITDFQLNLPQTNLRIRQAHIQLPPVDSSFRKNLASAPLRLHIAPSQICLKDISAFVPALRNFSDTIELSARADGAVDQIRLQHLSVGYNQQLKLEGKMELKGITRPSEAYLYGQVSNMFITTSGLAWLVNNFSRSPVALPQPLARLGTIDFTGEISGFFDNLVAYGKLTTAAGSLQTDLIFGKNPDEHIAAYLKGRVSTSSLHLGRLFPEGNPFGRMQVDIDIDAKRPENGHFAGKIATRVNEFDYQGYKYGHITVDGNFRRNAFDGCLIVDDPNASLHADGFFQHQGENSVFNFMARVKNFRPDRLNLTRKYEEPDISFALNADFSGNSIDNISGSIVVDSLSFRTKPSDFFLPRLEVEAVGYGQERKLTLSSGLVDGEVTGTYSFRTLVPSFLNTFRRYLPALINATGADKPVQENNFSLLLTVQNTEALSNTLKLPFTVLTPGRITGFYNNQYDRFRLEAYLPHFKLGKSLFQSGYVDCSNLAEQMDVRVKATNYNAKGRRNYLDLKLDARSDRLNTVLHWANNKEKEFSAELSASTVFSEEEGEKGKTSLLTDITLHPTRMVLNDSVWNISPARIRMKGKQVEVKDFYLYHNRQYAKINGLVSPAVEDTLNLELNDIELSNIFDILNIPVLQFAGKATGKFNICDLYGSRMLNTDLTVQDFSFNQVTLGRLNLFSEWDDAQKGIFMQGAIHKNDSAWTDVSGHIYPVKSDLRPAGLSLNFDAHDIDVSFLHPFMQKIAQGIQGRGFGKIHLHGPFNALSVEGDAFIRDGGLGIGFLNTYYTFSDSVHLDSTSIHIRNLTVYDRYRNRGSVDLSVKHRHFHDFDFLVDIKAKNMLMYDAGEKQNPLIYGTVFGSGSARIKGNGQVIDFDINMKSDPNTSVFLNFMSGSKAADYDFITFVDRNRLKEEMRQTHLSADSLLLPALTADEGAEMRMNFLLDITPDANIELIMDPIAGDRIKGTGSGSLQIQYGDKTDLRMYGNVAVLSGSYNFSLQQLIHKEFKIREGSMIHFNGDPLEANMNMNAIYNLTANIGDLDQNLALESPRTNVPVNCVLNLDGALRSPKISFDLELPGSNEELERQMKSLVDTEDMMTRQIVYLLVLNKFYTPEYTGTKGSNDFTAVASSALSSQLSSLLNSITDKVQIGTNIRASEDGITDTEVEMLLSSQLLNNRLIFNGNFGYKNNANQKNAFIGEFDLEYKLTKSGDIRLKAYNHANDMYRYLKQSLTTQGVGIMFKRDFMRFSEMFRRRRFLLPFTPRKEKRLQTSGETK